MIINVTIVPNAKFFEVEKIGENSYHIRVDAPPRDNKANNRLVEILEIYFKTKKSRIRIVKGTTSRKKVVEVL